MSESRNNHVESDAVASAVNDTAAVDAMIDAVAREMTSIDAPNGLRASVMEKVAGGGGRRLSIGWMPWAGVAAAAAVTLVAMVLMWPAKLVIAPIGERAAHASGGAADRDAGRTASTRSAAAQPQSGETGDSGQLRQVGRTAVPPSDVEQTAAEEFGPSPLAAPAAIAIDSLAPNAIDIPQIQVPEIGQIQPLSVKDIPVGVNDPQRR